MSMATPWHEHGMSMARPWQDLDVKDFQNLAMIVNLGSFGHRTRWKQAPSVAPCSLLADAQIIYKRLLIGAQKLVQSRGFYQISGNEM